MKMCRLTNDAIVSQMDVLITITKFECLVNALCQSYQHIIPRELPIAELNNLARNSNHLIINQGIQDILIGFRLLDDDGNMPDIIRSIISSALNYDGDKSEFCNPIIEIIGEPGQLTITI